MKFANLQKTLKSDYLAFLAITRSFFKDRDFLKHFGFIFGLYFVGILGIIRANIYYVDDNFRSLSGDPFAWNMISRRMMTKFADFFNFGRPYIDFSPFQNLICILFLSLASMILVKAINKKISYLALFGSLFVGLNPYFLENLLYKFDSIYMCISLFFTIFPFLFLKRLRLFFAISTLSLLIMLTTYQSVNFVYLLVVMFLAFIYLSQKRHFVDIFKFLIICFGAFCVALLVFKGFIYKPFHGHISTDIFSISQMPSGIAQNINKFCKAIYFDWCDTQFAMIFCYVFILAFITAILKFKNIRTIFYMSIFLICGFAFSQGIFLLLTDMGLYPRYISAIGVYFAIILIFLAQNGTIKIVKIANLCVIIYVAYGLIFVSNSLAQTLTEQNNHLEFKTNLFIQDLGKIENLNYENIHFRNSVIAPSIRESLIKFKIFNKIVRPYTELSLYGYNTLPRKIGYPNGPKCDPIISEQIVIFDNPFHTIKKDNNNCIVVEHKNIIDPRSVNKNTYLLSLIAKKPIIKHYALKDGFELSLYKFENPNYNLTNDKKLIFVFNKNVKKIAKKAKNGDKHLIIRLVKNREVFIYADKSINDFIQIGSRYFYIVNLADTNIDDIETIELGLLNTENMKFSINLDEIAKK